MNTTAYTPKIVVENELKFRIPLYQRPYTWERSQVIQLLEDLKKQFDNDNESPYYVGILSVASTNFDNNLYDLIDGQQRITTLTLIGLVLKDLHSEWNNFINNRLDLYGREEDKKYISTLDDSSNQNPKMVDAVKTVKKFLIESKIENKDFAKYIFEKASFFISEVPISYTLLDKNLQFVRMNNRGKQLEAHDILKIKLSSKLSANCQSDFITKWNNISQLGCDIIQNEENNRDSALSLEEILENNSNWNAPNEREIFYQSVVTFSEFLLIALARFDTKKNVSFNKEKLLEEFGFSENTYEWSSEKVLGFIALLSKQFADFNNFIIKRDKEEKYKFKDNELFSSEENSLKKILVFQSYLYVSRDAHKWLIDALNYLDEIKSKDKICSNSFLKYLKEYDNKEHELPLLENLKYGSVDRYWFWRLDYYLWENKENYFKENSLKVVNSYVFRPNRSVEHISPQTPKSKSNVIINDEVMNSFGNLAMISNGQNSSLQNESFEVKRAHVKSFIDASINGTTESLKMLKIYDFDTWNSKNVNIHGEEMFKILENSFSKIEENE